MIGERLAGGVVERHEALAPAFALDGHHLIVAGQHAAREPEQLRDAQAGGVERFEERVDAKRPPLGRTFACLLHAMRRGCKQRLDLGERQQFRQRPSELRAVDGRAGIVLAQTFGEQEAVELAHGRKLPRPRRGGETLAAQLREIGADRVGGSVERRLALGDEEGEVLAQVACVGLDGLFGGAALGPQHVEEERKLRLFPFARSAF